MSLLATRECLENARACESLPDISCKHWSTTGPTFSIISIVIIHSFIQLSAFSFIFVREKVEIEEMYSYTKAKLEMQIKYMCVRVHKHKGETVLVVILTCNTTPCMQLHSY